ncbi:hypothetical protein VE00_10682 [Pseudogymnoascus sp. WSF 3629]|nr:hypothetical protein VE00_10682 [Pseudogymnoascus sp. WSF 3629]
MPPRISLRTASRCLAIRPAPQPSIARHTPITLRTYPVRAFADSKSPKPSSNPTSSDALPNASEEAAQVGETTGRATPELDQGTPVQEILKRDPELAEKAPEVMKEKPTDAKKSVEAAGEEGATTFDNLLALGQMDAIANGGHASDVTAETVGHKFPLPDMPLKPFSNRKERYDPIVSQVTNLLMQHGKLSRAQRHMSYILNQLRTAPPPVPSQARPLVPGSPPPIELPLNPINYLAVAIDSIAPLMRIRQQKGAAGGGMSLPIPVPMSLRQRRRTAIMWILDTVLKKKSRGSGPTMFAQRFADEIISVVEGKSGVWDKRAMVHKAATSARVNLTYSRTKGRRL